MVLPPGKLTLLVSAGMIGLVPAKEWYYVLFKVMSPSLSVVVEVAKASFISSMVVAPHRPSIPSLPVFSSVYTWAFTCAF